MSHNVRQYAEQLYLAWIKLRHNDSCSSVELWQLAVKISKETILE